MAGDFIIICSSGMISEVMELHFNKAMFKKNVKVSDLKPTEDGYLFELEYVEKENDLSVTEMDKRYKSEMYRSVEGLKDDSLQRLLKESIIGKGVRDKRGRFVKGSEIKVGEENGSV